VLELKVNTLSLFIKDFNNFVNEIWDVFFFDSILKIRVSTDTPDPFSTSVLAFCNHGLHFESHPSIWVWIGRWPNEILSEAMSSHTIVDA